MINNGWAVCSIYGFQQASGIGPGKKVSLDRPNHTEKAMPKTQEDTSFISHKRLVLELKRKGAGTQAGKW